MACDRCGACCREVVTPLPAALSLDAICWLKWHGGRVIVEDGTTVGVVPCVCRKLAGDGRTCTVYANRPVPCRTYLCERAKADDAGVGT